MTFATTATSPHTQQHQHQQQQKQSLPLSKRRAEEDDGQGSFRIKKCPQHLLAYRILTMLVFLCLQPDFIVALKDVSVTIPQAVKRGSNAMLTCNYDMENDTLYSVKWYKGRREFYRYTPKENPAMKVFPSQSGLNVERNLSNQSHVVLLAVPLNISGKFTCEISVEAPSFQTAMVSGDMEVVELPEEQATVTGIQPRYRIGDLVDGNCSIKYSKPAANLTWTINGIVVPPHHIKTYQIEKYEEINLESVMSAVHFMVTTQHFIKGQMRLKCTASIFDIFKEEIESIIEEDRPRIMASGQSYPPDHGYGTNGETDGYEHNESYLTYFSAPKSSGARTAEFALDKILKFLKRQVLENYQLLRSLIETKTEYVLSRQYVNNLAFNNLIKMKTKYCNIFELKMIKFIMTALAIVILLQQKLLVKSVGNILTQDKQMTFNCIEKIRQMTKKKKDIFLAMNFWHKEKEQKQENENCYQDANDDDDDDAGFQAKCGQQHEDIQQQKQPQKQHCNKHCLVAHQNLVNEKVCPKDTNITTIQTSTKNKTIATPTTSIDCQNHMSSAFAFVTSCTVFHKPPSSTIFPSSSLPKLQSPSASSATTSLSLSTTRSCRKTYAHDSFPLYSTDASKSNNAKYMSKDQTLLMASTATAVTITCIAIVVVTAAAAAAAAAAASNSLYKTPSAFALLTPTSVRALVLEPKLLPTSVLLPSHSNTHSSPTPIFSRNNYLMAFIGELLLHQC